MFNNEVPHRVNIGERIAYPLSSDDACLSTVSSDDAMLQMSMKFYHQELLQSVDAIEFLKNRAIYSDNVIEHFNLGYSNRRLGLELQKLSKNDEEISRGALQRLGLLKSTGHELFYGAVTFPLLNQQGHVVSCYGRRITTESKPRKIYHRHWYSDGIGFFNCTALKDNEQLIYCKNPIDALSWWVNGFTHAISTIGSSDFNEQHAKLLKDNGIKTIYLAMGTTKNTLIEARRIAKLLKRKRIAVMLVLYPNGFDANSFIIQEINPKDELQQLLNSSHRYMVN